MSLAESSAQKSAAIGLLVKHITKAREVSICSTAASAQPLAGKSRINSLPPSQSNRDEPEQTHKNRLHKTSSSTSLSSNPSAAASVIANNEDLLSQLLLYLPPKSLLRFQCVSTGWHSVISNPAFRSLHSRVYPTTVTSSSATEALLLFRRRHREDIPKLCFISFSDEYVNSMANIVSCVNTYGELTDLHSCNGLLALVFKLNGVARKFIVYNPTTRQHRIIPQFNFQEGVREYVALNIVFDPLKSENYNLVCVWLKSVIISNVFEKLLFDEIYGFSVYASDKGSWRDGMETIKIDEFYLPIDLGNGVLWNGHLHWISYYKSTAYFDLENGVLNWQLTPCEEDLEGHLLCSGVSGGCLYGIEVYKPEPLLLDVLEMASDYSQWVLKWRVDLAPVVTLYPSLVDENYDPTSNYRHNFHIPCFLEDEKEKKGKLVISLPGKIILYDINDKIVKELAEVRPMGTAWWDSCFEWTDTYRHMETLATV